MDKATRFTLCDACTAAVVNDDYSAIDFYWNGQEAVDEYARVSALVDAMGNVTLTDETIPGYSQCWVCDHDEIDCHIWERAQ